MVSIEPSARNRAHRLVEELMVAANMAVARLLLDADQPCLHRVHDEPDPTKIETLAEVVGELGFRLEGDADDLQPSALQALLEWVAGRPEEHLVSMLVLRSMARAVYTPDPRGHYALATNAYLHFTSPIRRYPDLVAHRMLQALLRDGRAVEGEERDRLETALRSLGPQCSAKEQEAEKAERTAVQWKTALFLRDRVGEVFTRPGLRGGRLRFLCRARRGLRRRAGPHQGVGRRLLRVRRQAPPAGRRAHREGLAARRPGQGASSSGSISTASRSRRSRWGSNPIDGRCRRKEQAASRKADRSPAPKKPRRNAGDARLVEGGLIVPIIADPIRCTPNTKAYS